MMKTALLFPGQGSQYTGMGRELYEGWPVAARTFEEASEVLGMDLAKLCFEGLGLNQTRNTQPAVLAVSVAIFRVLQQETGIQAHIMAGHSLGEYSALVCAGALDFKDAVRIVHMRGKHMEEAVPENSGIMIAIIGADAEVLEELCHKYSTGGRCAVISNYNATHQMVISGHREAVDQVGHAIAAMGHRIAPLNVSGPFHSPLMQEAADHLAGDLDYCRFNDFRVPVLSNVTGLPYPDRNSVSGLLLQQMTRPVLWKNSMDYLKHHDVQSAVEVGPGQVLTKLLKKDAPEISHYSCGGPDDLAALGEAFPKAPGGCPAQSRLTFMTRCMAIAVATRNTNWDDDAYQKGVVEPYRRISGMVEAMEERGEEPTTDQVRQALDMLLSVFQTKGVCDAEQAERLNQLLVETGMEELIRTGKAS